MKTIISQRNFLKFYLTIILGTIYYLGMSFIVLYIYYKEIDNANTKIKIHILPFLSLGLFSLAIYSIYRYLKNAPNIILTKDYIKFNNQTWSYMDLKKVELTGKQSFKYILNFEMEAISLTFKNGETKFIFDDMYSNYWEIKSFLKQIVIDKKNVFESIANLENHNLNDDIFETYKGSIITSYRGIEFWAVFGLTGFLLLLKFEILYYLGFATFWFLMYSNFMHYFQVSDKYLMIRNHNFIWLKKSYHLNEIEEIVFEQQGKRPNSLRVITKNYKSKLYPAGTLSIQTWLDLKKKLETFKIKVRNEFIN